jgi:hypothetical protein
VAEAAVFRARDLAPAARRLGVSETGPSAGAQVRSVTERDAAFAELKLSATCRSALRSVAGELFAATSADDRSDAVALTAELLTQATCTQAEVDAFNDTTQGLLNPLPSP